MKDEMAALLRLKVVVIGVENSGKSTLVRMLSPGAKSVEHYHNDGDSITVGLDIGKMDLAGCSLYFFGTPGHKRFEFARKIVSRGANIGILLVDSVESTSRGISQRECELERELINSRIPYVICANKRDVSGVLPLSEIQKYFEADVHPVAAKNGHGVDELREVLVRLIEDNKHTWFSVPAKQVAFA